MTRGVERQHGRSRKWEARREIESEGEENSERQEAGKRLPQR